MTILVAKVASFRHRDAKGQSKLPAIVRQLAERWLIKAFGPSAALRVGSEGLKSEGSGRGLVKITSSF